MPNLLGLIFLLILWFILFEGAHVLTALLGRRPLVGWAIGPFGVTLMGLREPSPLLIWLDVLCPACVSGGVLYLGLFTSLSPLPLPRGPLIQLFVIISGILFSSTTDLLNALRDLQHPLWGEARILRTIRGLRATWSRIYFTSFGNSYVRDRFGANPSELLQAL